ncbi:hypothetical protein [Deinococcus roseus]|uniref:Pili assembly chaperone N-terminal domain-containing protein n=1 Tax=Deinococcus roseus TaxID=392414 RepID=A0ABQ2CWS4_9DEIO|nr:hypothetical protein [Deinococcus roseus]GGJ28366.1 hypothetical protein GCM10008938_13050 [Deinococcus roseus]
MTRIAALFAVPIAALLLGSAAAQVNITGPRDLELQPGESRTVNYVLNNPGDTEVPAVVFMNDYMQQPDGALVHIPAKTLPGSFSRIASFGRLEYTIPARGTVVVPVQITMPKTALGGYWGVVGVDVLDNKSTTNGNQVGFKIRYAMVTAVTVAGVTRHEISIDNLGGQTEKGLTALALTLSNLGTAYERYSLKVRIVDLQGKTVESQMASVLLPGLTVDLSLPIKDKLAAGTYGVFATLTYGKDEQVEMAGSLEVP